MSKSAGKAYDYVPQLSYCCVPAVLQMIFNRRGLLCQPQPYLGKKLGLTIPPDVRHQFQLVPISRPGRASGTRIDLEKFSLKKLFRDLALPLGVEFQLKNKIRDVDHLKDILASSLASKKRDTILSVQTGAIEGYPQKGSGHVLLLTALEGSAVHFIDPETGPDKTNIRRLYHAMRSTRNYDGLWHIDTVKVARPAIK